MRFTEEDLKQFIKRGMAAQKAVAGVGRCPTMPDRPNPRGRAVSKGMNKLEERYSNHLELLRKSGTIIEFLFQPVKLKLAGKTFYTPDFFVILPDVVEVHETKGFMRDDAAVKIKVAAKMFWFWKFKLVKEGGKNEWLISDV